MTDILDVLRRGETLLAEMLTLSLDSQCIDFGHVWQSLDPDVRAEMLWAILSEAEAVEGFSLEYRPETLTPVTAARYLDDGRYHLIKAA